MSDIDPLASTAIRNGRNPGSPWRSWLMRVRAGSIAVGQSLWCPDHSGVEQAVIVQVEKEVVRMGVSIAAHAVADTPRESG